MRRVHVVVTGDVQGVGYRYSLRSRADGAGVAGWVRNRPDGAVEAELEGDDAAVDEVLAWMRRGPAGASVTDIDAHDVAPVGASSFDIRS